MNTKQYISLLVLAVLLMGAPVWAQEGSSTATNPSATTAIDLQRFPPTPAPKDGQPEPLPPIRQPKEGPRPVLEARKELQDTRKQELGELRDMRQENRGEIKELREQGSSTDDIREKMKENRDEMERAREEARKDIKEKRQELRDELFQKFTVRLAALVDRLTKIGDRIEARIAELKTGGTDTTALEASLASARATIAQIKAKAATITPASSVDDQSTKDANKAILQEIKTLTESVKKTYTTMTYDLKPAKN